MGTIKKYFRDIGPFRNAFSDVGQCGRIGSAFGSVPTYLQMLDDLKNTFGIVDHLETCSSTARVSLAEVFHPWVRWRGPGSGFESSSASGAGGVWKSRICLPWD